MFKEVGFGQLGRDQPDFIVAAGFVQGLVDGGGHGRGSIDLFHGVVNDDGLAVIEKLFVLQVSLGIEPDLVRPLDIALQAEGECNLFPAS